MQINMDYNKTHQLLLPYDHSEEKLHIDSKSINPKNSIRSINYHSVLCFSPATFNTLYNNLKREALNN